MEFNREEIELIAKAFTAYKTELQNELKEGSELDEYNRIELDDLYTLAKRIDLEGDYFEVGEIPPNINSIIDKNLRIIISVIKAEIPQTCQEPDHVILKELKKYFKE